jgi:hypothetical protein
MEITGERGRDGLGLERIVMRWKKTKQAADAPPMKL